MGGQISYRPCKIQACEKYVVAWDLCDMHYRRLQRNGDVNTLKRKANNSMILQEVHAEILLTQDKVALVDIEDVPATQQYNWFACKYKQTFYAKANVARGKSPIYLHRLLLGFPEGLIDHIDRNGLDNRRSNLRVTSNLVNSMNRGPRKIGSSIYKGVSWNNKSKKWSAQIGFQYQRFHLGYYDHELEAAEAYDKKAIELYGDIVHLNFKQD